MLHVTQSLLQLHSNSLNLWTSVRATDECNRCLQQMQLQVSLRQVTLSDRVLLMRC